MRVRITNPNSLFRGEEGEVLRSVENSVFGDPAYLIAFDTRGFGEHPWGLAFAAWEVLVLTSESEALNGLTYAPERDVHG